MGELYYFVNLIFFSKLTIVNTTEQSFTSDFNV